VADPNQTPSRGEWLCPCSGCQKSISAERKQLIELFEKTKNDYLIYRGSSFHKDTGELMIEQWTSKPCVAGSIPARGAMML
jgi:hypothetical protein